MRVLRSLCDRSGTLLVLTAHNAMPHEHAGQDPAVVRRNLNCAHLVVALTDHVAAELAAEIGTKTPIAVVPHGPLFADRALPSRADAATRLGWASGPTVLFLGLIRAYKGVDLLADAWPEVLESIPNARLLVVGKVLDPAATADLNRLRMLPGVEVVDRYVPVARMLDLYAVSDVVVLPYRRISQSAGLMTAAGLGRPTVITPVDGLLEQVQTLTSTIVADDLSGPAVARALSTSLHRSDELQAAAERDRDAIADSAIGWAAVARATIDAYATASKRPT
jgi:glycosyltransferase involved in cell wall biosynthesis